MASEAPLYDRTNRKPNNHRNSNGKESEREERKKAERATREMIARVHNLQTWSRFAFGRQGSKKRSRLEACRNNTLGNRETKRKKIFELPPVPNNRWGSWCVLVCGSVLGWFNTEYESVCNVYNVDALRFRLHAGGRSGERRPCSAVAARLHPANDAWDFDSEGLTKRSTAERCYMCQHISRVYICRPTRRCI